VDAEIEKGRDARWLGDFIQDRINGILDGAMIMDTAERQRMEAKLYQEMMPPELMERLKLKGATQGTSGNPTAGMTDQEIADFYGIKL